MAARPSGAAAERELVVTRVLDAPRELVFRVWTDPAHAARWWGPKGFALISCRMDVRPGGRWSRHMRSPGGTDSRKHGIYREVVAPERLVFTYSTDEADGSPGVDTLVTVTFADDGGRTRLTLHQTGFASDGERDDHRGGWTSCLERLAEHLAAA